VSNLAGGDIQIQLLKIQKYQMNVAGGEKKYLISPQINVA
jgi:hypothetical protein